MDGLQHAREQVQQVLAHSASPAVLCGFGKDSILLLDLVREAGVNPPVVWFRTGLDGSYARRMIGKWGLTAFGWLPAERYLLRDGDRLTVVHEYGINGTRLPMLIDVVEGGPCCDPPPVVANVTVPFDVLLVGWKDTDSHWVKGGAALAKDGFALGHSQLFAPLRHMTNEGVRAAIIDREIPFTPTPDELPVCTHCLDTVPVEEFRSKFDLTEEVDHGPGIC